MKPLKFYCIDSHNHVHPGPDGKFDQAQADMLLKAADKLGIDKLCVSVPLTDPCPTPEEVRAANDVVLAAMAYSDRFYGFAFINPGFAKEAIAEIDRCIVAGGMKGLKMYHQYFICDPIQRTVMERAAELGIPVLMHAGKVCDRESIADQPRLSAAEHFQRALEMFPDTMLIQGHIGGGGDWEWNLRVLEEIKSPNYYIDLSGSVIDRHIARRTVEAIGIDHVLFATDESFEEGVGKVLDGEFSDGELEKIFHRNLETIFERRTC